MKTGHARLPAHITPKRLLGQIKRLPYIIYSKIMSARPRLCSTELCLRIVQFGNMGRNFLVPWSPVKGHEVKVKSRLSSLKGQCWEPLENSVVDELSR